MEKNSNELILANTRCWTDVIEGLKYTVKSWVKEVVEEVISEKMCDLNMEDKRLNADELCERWNISKSTLYNWEKDGIIEPLHLGGRRKIYSMKAILDAESEGLIKTEC
ncbi:MAG: hypothetical protein AUK63_1246 [bacterium P3]|nr:MAG: hypothetical protein AUK63_1246 [bacterium P3]KWW40522.1 MAG: hypothetical protein F083_1591 [bacterium F083]